MKRGLFLLPVRSRSDPLGIKRRWRSSCLEVALPQWVRPGALWNVSDPATISRGLHDSGLFRHLGVRKRSHTQLIPA